MMISKELLDELLSGVERPEDLLGDIGLMKELKGNDGVVRRSVEITPIDIPRDRDSSFEPELIRKGQTRIDGMDDKIIRLYVAGLSTRDIIGHLEDVYGLRISADLISRVTDVF